MFSKSVFLLVAINVFYVYSLPVEEISRSVIHNQANALKSGEYKYGHVIDDGVSGGYQQKDEISENGVVKGGFAYDDGYIKRVVNYYDDGHGMVFTKDEITPSQKAHSELTGKAYVKLYRDGDQDEYVLTNNPRRVK
ncbi:hypothetical protein NQ317_000553 [Molorchus minor]|uniref:Uncharacterized protein n=1 Tax=Molorchus minor TaxID=1323400 RepID=A0ABQ9JRX4_9CUCU|nr:hypothetical protein NQ317_000553 [Molorchus minor]